MAFINDNNSNMMYNNSKQLLYKMYHLCFPQAIVDNIIRPAPHWRLLKIYGGHLTIEEFRENYHKIQYIENNFTNKSVSWIFQEDITF